MRVIKLSQQQDREAWLDLRRGKVTGSKAKAVKPLSRGADRTPQGFWTLLAEKVCIKQDGEPDMDRGSRLENDALQILADTIKQDIDLDPGMWVSDLEEDMAVSPDGAEKADIPTWAAEAKCLSSANHLKYIIKDMAARKADNYRPINSIPSESKCAFKEQVIQYFVTNEKLEKLYFVLHDDRVALDKYVTYIIEIKREGILDEIEAQRESQVNLLKEVKALIQELAKE